MLLANGDFMDALGRKSEELAKAGWSEMPNLFSSKEGGFDCWNRVGVNGDGTCSELAAFVHCRNCSVYSAAGRRLLDREPPPGYRQYWTEYFSHQRKSLPSDKATAVIFRIGPEWLSLATRVFREVAARQTIHSLPHRQNGMVLGVANVHGQLVPCVSLRRLLAIEEENGKEQSNFGGERLMVSEWQGSLLTFPVSEVHGVEWHHLEQIKEAPATVAKAKANLMRGVLPWRDRMVGCLDEELLFAALDRSLK